MAIAAHSTQTRDSEEAAKTSAARLSMLAAAFLIMLKTVTGFITGSISVWASLLEEFHDYPNYAG